MHYLEKKTNKKKVNGTFAFIEKSNLFYAVVIRYIMLGCIEYHLAKRVGNRPFLMQESTYSTAVHDNPLTPISPSFNYVLGCSL